MSENTTTPELEVDEPPKGGSDLSCCALFDTKLSNAEQERLACLLEECGEIQQAIGKILRHGYESADPTKRKPRTNRENLEREIGDFQAILELMKDDLDQNSIMRKLMAKREQLKIWTHFQFPSNNSNHRPLENNP